VGVGTAGLSQDRWNKKTTARLRTVCGKSRMKSLQGLKTPASYRTEIFRKPSEGGRYKTLSVEAGEKAAGAFGVVGVIAAEGLQEGGFFYVDAVEEDGSAGDQDDDEAGPIAGV
jgi:hypothetical protein